MATRTFHVTYYNLERETHYYEFDLSDDPAKEWKRNFPELTAEEYILLAIQNVVFWNCPTTDHRFIDHLKDKSNYTVEEMK